MCSIPMPILKPTIHFKHWKYQNKMRKRSIKIDFEEAQKYHPIVTPGPHWSRECIKSIATVPAVVWER